MATSALCSWSCGPGRGPGRGGLALLAPGSQLGRPEGSGDSSTGGVFAHTSGGCHCRQEFLPRSLGFLPAQQLGSKDKVSQGSQGEAASCPLASSRSTLLLRSRRPTLAPRHKGTECRRHHWMRKPSHPVRRAHEMRDAAVITAASAMGHVGLAGGGRGLGSPPVDVIQPPL